MTIRMVLIAGKEERYKLYKPIKPATTLMVALSNASVKLAANWLLARRKP